MSIYKIQQFYLYTVDFCAKTLLFRTHQARNSMTYLTLAGRVGAQQIDRNTVALV